MDDLKVEILGGSLKGKKIAFCVSGGIAAIETPKVVRHLRRYGADVKVYTTSSALKFVGRASLEWASEQPIVMDLSGLAEHICLEDLILVAPATLNTFNKIFNGIADNPVTSLVASALGSSKPIYIAPTMHESLYKNPFFQENLGRAKNYGVKIIQPRFSEGKAKIASTKSIVNEVRGYFDEKP